MNILFGVPHRTHRAIALHEVDGMTARGHSTHTFTFGNRGNEGAAQRLLRILLTGIEARRLIKARSVDLLYLNSAFDLPALIRDLITLLLVRGTGVVSCIKMHGAEIDLLKRKNLVVRALIMLLRRWCDGIGVLSSEEFQPFRAAGFPGQRSFIQKNIVDQSEYRVVTGLPALKDAAPSAMVLLYAGRLMKTKGVLDILEAAKSLKRQGREFIVVFMGDGPLMETLRERTLAWGLEHEVRFTGFIPEAETRGYYAAARMLVFPTYHDEGLPMAVLHSLAAGLAIVTTRIRAAADYLQDENNCLWVPARDPVALGRAIGRLIDDPWLMARMSAHNRALATGFARDVVCNELDTALSNLVATRTKKNRC